MSQEGKFSFKVSKSYLPSNSLNDCWDISGGGVFETTWDLLLRPMIMSPQLKGKDKLKK